MYEISLAKKPLCLTNRAICTDLSLLMVTMPTMPLEIDAYVTPAC